MARIDKVSGKLLRAGAIQRWSYQACATFDLSNQPVRKGPRLGAIPQSKESGDGFGWRGGHLLGSLSHRGPDHEGRIQLSPHGSFLVNTRLAIVDKSDDKSAGHQPFVSPDGRNALVCNGANIKGELKADSVTVEGQVKANVSAKKVELKPKAKLEGDLRANRLDVAEGSEFIGQCHVGSNALEPTKQASPTQIGKPVMATVKV